METNTEIPSLKLAKVGDKRRRHDKGGALLGLGGGAGAGTAGGTGALATVVVKIGVAVLVATLGAGAYNLGVSMRPDDSKFAAKKKPKAFASAAKPKYEGDLSSLPATKKPGGDSLSMVSGSLGENPDQQATQTAPAEQNKAPAEPTPPPDAAAATPAGMNPADMMAAAAKAGGAPGADAEKDKKKQAFSTRFGALSSNLGGQSGLAGGGGLSGGIGRGFDMPKFGSSSGRMTGFQSAGRAPNLTARVSRAGGQRGKAFGQLKKSNQFSNNARSLTGEGGAEQARLAFDQNSGMQSPLSGSGLGAGRSPTDHAMDAPTNPSAGGGPTEGQPYTGSNTGSKGGGGDDGGKNVSKWKPWADIAAMMSLLATALLLIVRLDFDFITNHVRAFGWVIMSLGIGIVLAGLAILGMGQTYQGIMFTAIGALFTTVGAIIGSTGAIAGHGAATSGFVHFEQIVLNMSLLIAALGGTAGGMGLSGASHHWDA